MPQYPNWVRKDPARLSKRFTKEMRCLLETFPRFAFEMDDGVLYAKGHLLTPNGNPYSVRLYYPDDFPYSPPQAMVFDRDVKAHCLALGKHKAHNFGEHLGGIMLCLMPPNSDKGDVCWEPDKAGYYVLSHAALWLCAYEIQKESGRWILPEA